VGLVTKKRHGREGSVDVFGDLVKTGVVEAIELGPEINFRNA
jgi:hypothetical protein